jgi:hypothetical protein
LEVLITSFFRDEEKTKRETGKSEMFFSSIAASLQADSDGHFCVA